MDEEEGAWLVIATMRDQCDVEGHLDGWRADIDARSGELLALVQWTASTFVPCEAD
jgi:hypothetical protein